MKDLLYHKLGEAWKQADLMSKILSPLGIGGLLEKHLKILSQGELQKVAVALALAKPCELYLLDEPSSHLDQSEKAVLS